MIQLLKNLKTGVINVMKNVLVLKQKVRLTNVVCFGSSHLYISTNNTRETES